MKYDELHEEITQRLNALEIAPQENQVIVLSQKDYDLLFWDLIKLKAQNESTFSGIDLISQLNSYIDSHRNLYSPHFRIKNPSKVIRPSPPLKAAHIKDVHLIEQADELLLESLSLANLPNSVLLGRLLYCAARHGGLVNRAFLDSFMSSLHLNELTSCDGLVWFELSGSANERHSWFPDSLSLLLIKQWFSVSDVVEEIHLPEYYILQFWHFFGFNLESKLNLSWFFRVIISRLSLSVTPFSLDILAGKQLNLSLKMFPHLRLLTQKTPTLPVGEIIIDNSAAEPVWVGHFGDNTKAISFEQSEELLLWTKSLLKNYKKELRTSNTHSGQSSVYTLVAREIRTKLESDFESITPLVRLLVAWTHNRLTKSRSGVWSSKLKPSTLLSYLSSIAKPLQTYFGYRDPVNASAEEFEHIYLLIIDAGKNIAVKARRARILRDFHCFLEIEHSVKPCYLFQEFIAQGIKDRANLVDANILMPWEYEAALSFLMQPQELTGLSEVQSKAVLVALILGFRCGLRRSELLFTKLDNFEWEFSRFNGIPDWGTLFITYSEERDLKSISSQRRLPIGLLLNKKERDILYDYLVVRLAFGDKDSEFLFFFGEKTPFLSRSAQVVHPDHLFLPLTKLLQRVTGDNSFRYHHLRHSFATWLFWYWTADIHEFHHPILSLKRNQAFEHLIIARESLLHRETTLASRKTLHLISSLIGHSGPSITLYHYIHSASWVIWSDFSQQIPEVTDQVKAFLADVSTRTLYRKNIEYAEATDPFSGFDRYLHAVLAARSKAINTQSWQGLDILRIDSLASNTPVRVNELTIYRALQHYYDDPQEDTQRIISAYQLDSETFINALNNTKYFLSQQQSKLPKGTKIDRMKNHQRRRYLQTKKVVQVASSALPKLPKISSGSEVIFKILARYHQLSPDEQQKVLFAAKYMVDFSDVHWSELRFSANEPIVPSGKFWLNVWFEAIRLIDRDGDFLNYVRLTLVSRHAPDEPLRNSWWSFWTQGLDVPHRSDRSNENYLKRAHVYLDIINSEILEVNLANYHSIQTEYSIKQRRVPAQEGFRLAFYILFFVHYRM